MIGYSWFATENPCVISGGPLPKKLGAVADPVNTALMSDIMIGWSPSGSPVGNVGYLETDYGYGINTLYIDGHVGFRGKADAVRIGPRIVTNGMYFYLW